MAETLNRQWMLLRLLPRYPVKITTSDVLSRLEAQGYTTTLRTIQRDLDDLSMIWPISCDTRSKPFGWYWEQNAPLFDLPGMDNTTALSFQMMQLFLTPLLPQVVLTELQPYFEQATKMLTQRGKPGLTNWSQKIRFLSRTQPLVPAVVDTAILNTIQHALFMEQQIRAEYLPREQDDHKTYTLNPLGLIYRESVMYLLAIEQGESTIKHFSLHRFQQADLLEVKVSCANNFNIDDYIAQHFLHYPVSSANIQLHALFDADAARHLEETPLHHSQQLLPHDDGRVLLKVSIKDTAQLRWWLQSFGAYVEIIKPTSLRQEFVQIAQSLAQRYQ